MAYSSRNYRKPILPTAASVTFARELVHQLGDDGPRFVLQDRETGNIIEIEETVFELFRQLLIDFARNRPVSLIPLEYELTTHQAADLLNVSRGYVLKLLEQGEIKYHMVGTHRRIRLEDLLDYKEKMRADSDAAMDELAVINRELEIE
jgi:excisionase family DNA binding protein